VNDGHYQVASLVVQLAAAIGTVGALFAALAAIRLERDERRRSEVRGVRFWLEWVDDPSGPFEPPTENHSPLIPRLNVENQSDEFVYDVCAMVSSSLTGRLQSEIHLGDVAPRGKVIHTVPMRVDTVDLLLGQVTAYMARVDLAFRDSRGDRWNRSDDGHLRLVRPVRWYAPWRVPDESDWSTRTPWWAVRSKWKHWRRDRRFRTQSGARAAEPRS